MKRFSFLILSVCLMVSFFGLGEATAYYVKKTTPATIEKANELFKDFSGNWLVDFHLKSRIENGQERMGRDLGENRENEELIVSYIDGAIKLLNSEDNEDEAQKLQLVRVKGEKAFFSFKSDELGKNSKTEVEGSMVFDFNVIPVKATGVWKVEQTTYLDNEGKDKIEEDSLLEKSEIIFKKKIAQFSSLKLSPKDLADKVFLCTFTSTQGQKKEINFILSPHYQWGVFQNYRIILKEKETSKYDNKINGQRRVCHSINLYKYMSPTKDFEGEWHFFSPDCRYDFFGHYFKKEGKISIQGKYRVQNVKYADKERKDSCPCCSAKDWAPDSKNPIREEGTFEAIETEEKVNYQYNKYKAGQEVEIIDNQGVKIGLLKFIKNGAGAHYWLKLDFKASEAILNIPQVKEAIATNKPIEYKIVFYSGDYQIIAKCSGIPDQGYKQDWGSNLPDYIIEDIGEIAIEIDGKEVARTK